MHGLGSPAMLEPVELMLQTVKGTALIATRGWGVSEVGEAFARAAAVSRKLTGTQHTPALWGLWVHSFMRGELGVARQYSEEILRIGKESGYFDHPDRGPLDAGRDALLGTSACRIARAS